MGLSRSVLSDVAMIRCTKLLRRSALLLGLLVSLPACGTSEQVHSAQPSARVSPSVDTQAAVSAPTSAPAASYSDSSQIEGLQGDRLPVIDAKSGQTGYVDSGAIIPAPPGRVPDLSPVYDSTGKQIAYWGNGLGWLSISEVENPDFDYQQRLADSQQH